MNWSKTVCKFMAHQFVMWWKSILLCIRNSMNREVFSLKIRRIFGCKQKLTSQKHKTHIREQTYTESFFLVNWLSVSTQPKGRNGEGNPTDNTLHRRANESAQHTLILRTGKCHDRNFIYKTWACDTQQAIWAQNRDRDDGFGATGVAIQSNESFHLRWIFIHSVLALFQPHNL